MGLELFFILLVHDALLNFYITYPSKPLPSPRTQVCRQPWSCFQRPISKRLSSPKHTTLGHFLTANIQQLATNSDHRCPINLMTPHTATTRFGHNNWGRVIFLTKDQILRLDTRPKGRYTAYMHSKTHLSGNLTQIAAMCSLAEKLRMKAWK
jgi:hypothetical protein